ncbi:hypothetical protein HEQ75_21545, partial [Roseomonas sp. BU-1]|nr:hypothetical protein [Falsiroseomonas selenitidurans]
MSEARRIAGESLREMGWRALRGAPGGLAVAHPAFGVALLDLAPDPDADADPVATLRRQLSAQGFAPDALPVIHRALTPADLWRLPLVLDHAFAAAPPLGALGGAWVDEVQAALEREAAPAEAAAAPPAPMPAPILAAPIRPAEAARPPRLLRLATAGVLLLLGAGGVLLHAMEQPPRPAPAIPPEAERPAAAPGARQPPSALAPDRVAPGPSAAEAAARQAIV